METCAVWFRAVVFGVLVRLEVAAVGRACIVSEGSSKERMVLKLLFSPTAQVCPLPPVVSHGDFICHPRPCERYNHGTVVEFYCDPGYSLTSDYKYITCQYGEWFPSYQVYCIKSGETGGQAFRGGCGQALS